MIVLIQVAFDLSTPQVSMAAHLCGLITGAALGLMLAPRHTGQGYKNSSRFGPRYAG